MREDDTSGKGQMEEKMNKRGFRKTAAHSRREQ